MRIWSIHPMYLDAKGLVAVWREALLAKKVLEGTTHGYRNHPQLNRFWVTKNPVDTINQYLAEIFFEASRRNYNFDKHKINWKFKKSTLSVTNGQLNYEVRHLLAKLKIRDVVKYKALKTNTKFVSHPLFKVLDGDIENWEIIARK